MSTTMLLPPEVISFVRAHVDHTVKLQFLIAMHLAPNGTTTMKAIALELDVPKGQVRDMANELVDGGLLRVSAERLQLSPSTLEDRLALSDLAAAYTRNRDAIVELVRTLCGASSC